MNPIEQTALVIECERLRGFLENNQLVQANGLVQKLVAILQETIAKESVPETAEKHAFWLPFRSAMRIRAKILGGITRDALAEADVLAGMLRR